jgi:hypothetical protein
MQRSSISIALASARRAANNPQVSADYDGESSVMSAQAIRRQWDRAFSIAMKSPWPPAGSAETQGVHGNSPAGPAAIEAPSWRMPDWDAAFGRAKKD